MKRLIVIILIVNTVALHAQNKNGLIITLQPQDLGLGLMYMRIWDKAGVYTSVSKGNYRISEINDIKYYINDHLKIAAGIAIPAVSTDAFLLIGISRHYYGKMNLPPLFNQMVINPTSIELGVSGRAEWLQAGFRYDIFKHVGCFDIGLSF